MLTVLIGLNKHVFRFIYSLNKKSEYVHSLRSESLEKSEIQSEFGVNICVIHSYWSDHRDHSGIPSDPWGHSKMSE